MRMLRGGSAQTASGHWVKFDVELDETDLQRMLVQHDLLDVTLTVREVFSLLEAEAETLVLLKMEQLGAKGDRSVKEQAAVVTKLLEKLRAKVVR